MKKILLISFFNSNNIGDRAICQVLEKELSPLGKIYTMDISGVSVKTENISNDIDKTTADIPQKCNFYDIKSFCALRRIGRLDYAKSLIKKSDLILLAGGNMIMDLEKFSYYSFLCDKYIKFAKEYNKKAAFVFVGVGKISTYIQKKKWEYVLMNCDFISVRDSLSKKKMTDTLNVKNEIRVWKDPVFMLDNIKEMKDNKKIAINIYLEAVKDENERRKLKSLYIYIIKELKKHYKIILYSTEKNDFKGLNEIYYSFRENERLNLDIEFPTDTSELLDMYKTIDVVVATRMHSFIIAITQNIPAIVLSWDNKIDGVAHDVGLSEFVYDIHNAVTEKKSFLIEIEHIMLQKENYSRHISSINEKIKSDFYFYLHQIKELLDN